MNVFDSRLDEFREKLTAVFSGASHLLFYTVATDGTKSKTQTNFELNAASVVKLGLATAEELEDSEDPAGIIVPAAIEWIRNEAATRTPPGGACTFFVRASAPKGESYLASATFECRSEAEDADQVPVTGVPDLEAAGKRFEMRALEILSGIADQYEVLIKRQVDSDRLLNTKIMRSLDVADRTEALFAAREARLIEQLDAANANVTKTVDKVLELRVREVEAREKAVAHQAAAGAKGEDGDNLTALGNRLFDIVESTVAYENGVPPEMAKLAPKLAKNPGLLEILKGEKFAKLVDDPNVVEMLNSVMDAYDGEETP